jgi:uncharacterized FlgJ-related protein
MFKHKRLIACGLILFPLLMCIITCGFGSCDRKTEPPQTSSEELSEPISEDITPSLLEEIDELKEALLEKENELDKIKIEKEDLENQVVSMEQEFQNEIQQIREEVYKLIEKDILGFNKPEAKIKLVPIKTKDDDVGNITVQIFDNDNITYLQQRTWFFYEVFKAVPEDIPSGIKLECLLVMAFTEGGASTDGVYTKTNNLFGLGATDKWKGLVYDRKKGVLYKDYATARSFGFSGMLFRAYPSIEDSIKDYISVMQSNRYEEVLNTTSNQSYLKSLYSNGYCNNYNSVSEWLYLIKRFDLKNFVVDNKPLIDFLKKL